MTNDKLETVAGTVNTAEMSKEQKGAPKRTRKKSPFDLIRKRAVNLFKFSIDKSATEKALCLAKALFYYNGKMTYNADDFENEYTKRLNLLLDSTSFCNYAKGHGFDPQAAATHLVFYNSKTKIGKLLLNEDYSIFNSYKEWQIPIPYIKVCDMVSHVDKDSLIEENVDDE